MVYCATMPKAQLLRHFVVTKGSFQRDGTTLVQGTMIRYVESVCTVVRSIIESRIPSPNKDEAERLKWESTKTVTNYFSFFISMYYQIKHYIITHCSLQLRQLKHRLLVQIRQMEHHRLQLLMLAQ
jgi:hypothetical protein